MVFKVKLLKSEISTARFYCFTYIYQLSVQIPACVGHYLLSFDQNITDYI